jgi:transposase
VKGLLPGKKSDAGRTAGDNRKFMDAVLWIARTGSHWRELPPEFGNWNSAFQRYNRWSKKGVWESLFKALADDPDFEFVMMDATIVRAHQHSAGAKGGDQEAEAIGRSRGGLTTKLHALCDALGNPVRLILTPGNIAECTQAEPLLAGIVANDVLADKGYDSDAIVACVEAAGAGVVIPPKANRVVQRLYDFALYCERNLVERFFNKIKHYRAIATRYAKRKPNYMAFVSLFSVMLWIK